MTLAVLWTLILYLLAGIFADALVTAYTLSVGKGWALASSGLSLVITLLNLWILGRVLFTDPWYALAYAAGNAVGCYVIMLIARKRLKV